MTGFRQPCTSWPGVRASRPQVGRRPTISGVGLRPTIVQAGGTPALPGGRPCPRGSGSWRHPCLAGPRDARTDLHGSRRGVVRRAVPPHCPPAGHGPVAGAADGGGGGAGGRRDRGGGSCERSLHGLVPIVARIAAGIGELRDHPGRRHSGGGLRRAGAARGAARVLAPHRELRARAGDRRAGAAVRGGPGRRRAVPRRRRPASVRPRGTDRRIVGVGERIARHRRPARPWRSSPATAG